VRCRRIREAVLEEGASRSAAVEEHLRTCVSCAQDLRRWDALRTGLRQAAEEAPPEPSLGFARRVAARLRDPAVSGRLSDLLLVRAGRRFVYAALTAALLLFLGLLVPASGPVRSPSAVVDVAQPETISAQNYPIFSGQLMDNDFEFAQAAGSR
jgi:anti-sigma factor RsiW